MAYYNLDKIRDLFAEQRAENFDLTEREYPVFCAALQRLPKEIVDRIKRDVFFVLMSACRKNAACKFCLGNKREKRAVIVYSPLMFGYPSGSCGRHKDFLHEVAHFILDHRGCRDEAEKLRLDQEANKLAAKWEKEYRKSHRTA
jgi:hypothetical protein